jgi:hypothetical protein
LLGGGGCAGSNGFRPFHYAFPETTLPGAIMATQLEGIESSQALAIHMLGFNSLPAPFDVGTVGATPGCLLRIDPALFLTAPVSNPNSQFQRAISRVQVPLVPQVVGQPFYSQWFSFDNGLGAGLPIVFSDAQLITIGQVPPASIPARARTIWKFGATGFDLDSGKMVSHDYGPVLRFN